MLTGRAPPVIFDAIITFHHYIQSTTNELAIFLSAAAVNQQKFIQLMFMCGEERGGEKVIIIKSDKTLRVKLKSLNRQSNIFPFPGNIINGAG